jgi:hypothetical protein
MVPLVVVELTHSLSCFTLIDDGSHVHRPGPTFRQLVVKPDGSLDYNALLPICRQLRVMGRCSPTDKYNLVRALKHFGQVCLPLPCACSR